MQIGIARGIANHDFKVARFDEVFHVHVIKRERFGRDVERDGFGFAGDNRIFSKPLNSLTGRVTELTRSRIYICTTSVPARLPVFFTSTRICVGVAEADFLFGQTRIFEGERRVTQTKAKRIKRRNVVENITPARGWFVIVKRRQMSGGARNCDRHLPPGL